MTSDVLLIDDSKTSIAYYNSILLGHGIESDGVTTPEEGVQMALEGNYRCIITDHEMPGMTGTEVCSAIKSEKPYIPVIILTSKEDEETIQLSIKSGADNFILKKEAPYFIALKVQNAMKLADLQKEHILNKQTESIRNMITTYNHEFNNLLAILQMDIQIHTKKFHTEDAETMDKICNATKRIVELVGKISEIEEYEDKNYIDGIDMVEIHKEKK